MGNKASVTVRVSMEPKDGPRSSLIIQEIDAGTCFQPDSSVVVVDKIKIACQIPAFRSVNLFHLPAVESFKDYDV